MIAEMGRRRMGIPVQNETNFTTMSDIRKRAERLGLRGPVFDTPDQINWDQVKAETLALLTVLGTSAAAGVLAIINRLAAM